MKNYAVIVAGGSGTRMGSAIPKQFLLLNGLPVLMHTLSAFQNSQTRPELILVIHPDFYAYWQQLCSKYHFTIPHQLVKGGESRFQSVKNGIHLIPGNVNAIVAIHDAVRPLTATEIIDNSYSHAGKYGNAVTAVQSRDSVRHLKNDHSVSLLRDEIYLIQTPQTFRLEQLKKAYRQPYDVSFTDDARVVERTGETIHLIEGSYQNIKITFPEDIAIAQAILNKEPSV